MKAIVVLILVVAGLALCERYTNRYDSINIEEILANRRLLLPYIKCALDKGPCTAEGKELKIHIRDGMQTACAKCTNFQRRGARKVVKHIRKNEQQFWEELLKKYDPKNEYKEIYENFLKTED